MHNSERKKINEHFGRKMNGNRNEVSNTARKEESYGRIKDGDGRLTQG